MKFGMANSFFLYCLTAAWIVWLVVFQCSLWGKGQGEGVVVSCGDVTNEIPHG